MSYRVMTKVTFTPEFGKLSQEQQGAELIATLEIVSRNGGTIETTTVVPGEAAAYTVAVYPDDIAATKTHIQIQARGAYVLAPQPAYTLEEWQKLMTDATAEALVKV